MQAWHRREQSEMWLRKRFFIRNARSQGKSLHRCNSFSITLIWRPVRHSSGFRRKWAGGGSSILLLANFNWGAEQDLACSNSKKEGRGAKGDRDSQRVGQGIQQSRWGLKGHAGRVFSFEGSAFWEVTIKLLDLIVQCLSQIALESTFRSAAT